MVDRVGIIGCGWLGRALGEFLVSSGALVVGTTTTEENARQLAQFGIQPLIASFSPDLRGEVSALQPLDAIVVSVPPGRQFDPIEQASSVANVIAGTNASTVVQISTTSVYPADGERVVESDAVPSHPLCRVEDAYRNLDRGATILRCAGLFGPGRHILPFLLRSGAVVDEGAPVNFVEQSDVVRAIVRVLEAPAEGTFNICADEHPTKGEFYREIAKRSGMKPPEFRSAGEAFKIVDNRRFKDAFAFEYGYPDPLGFPVDA